MDLIGRGDHLEERLARLETAEEARSLIAAYARACDEHDLDAMAAVLHPDIVVSTPETSWRGRVDVIGFFRTSWAANSASQRHFIANVAVDRLEPSGADATASFWHVTASDDRSLVGWGSYRDTYLRHEGRLLLLAKHIRMDVQVSLADGWAGALTDAG